MNKTTFISALVLVIGTVALAIFVSRGSSSQEHPLIRVSAPRMGEIITSPLKISGEARGNWYFEASFPLELLDAAGNQIAQGFATAEGEWMTEEFVPFEAVIIFPSSVGNGTLVLHKDNPSGLPEHDAQVEIPVRFR